jgi:hypothetical protein
MPVISVTGRSARRRSSAGRSSTARAPNGLAASEISLARVRVRAMPTVTGTRNRSQIRSRIASASLWNSSSPGGVSPLSTTAWKKNSSIE